MKLFYFKIKRLINLTGYLSIHKLTNWLALIISYMFSFFGFQKVQKIYPSFISVEVTNFCNLFCPECPVGKGIHSNTAKLSFNYALYKKLIDELKPTLQHVILYFQGEPFLNKQLFELINYTHKAGIYSSTSTNGQFLTEKNSKEVVLSGLDKLIVSIDGSTQETFETYRVGGHLQKTIDGIKSVIAWKKELKSITPLIEIQFLVLKTNEHQMKEMKKLAKSLNVDRLSFKSAQLYDFENGSELLTSKNNYARYKLSESGKYVIKGRQPNHCRRMWSGAVINVRGEVIPCCFDKSSEHTFGNIYDNTFLKCWESNNASVFKNKILHNRKQFEMCRNCTSQ